MVSFLSIATRRSILPPSSKILPSETDRGENRGASVILDKARDAIHRSRPRRKILYWNKGAERIYGWSHEEALGRNVVEILSTDPKKFEELNGLTISQGDGMANSATGPRTSARLPSNCSTLIRDNEGHPKSVLAINTDVTEEKKTRGPVHAGAADGKHRYAGRGNRARPEQHPGADHDVHRASQGNFEYPQAAKILETIGISAKRGADIVKQVLTFARGLGSEKIEVQLKHLLADIETIIKDTFPKDIRLQFSIPNDTWTILSDPTQVHQILLNLCVNARDAMPSGGDLSVGVENCMVDEQYAAMNLQAKPGRYVCINVTDSGTGIPDHLLDKIFDPFFTTKPPSKGTGLGLSTVMGIVKNHGRNKCLQRDGKGNHFQSLPPCAGNFFNRRRRYTGAIHVAPRKWRNGFGGR